MVIEGARKPVKRLRIVPLYDCASMCGRQHGSIGDDRARAAMRCSLPDFDPAKWDPRADRSAAAEADDLLGTLRGLASKQRLTLDHELDRDGCPWGWVVSRWATSVAAYMGRRDSDSEVRGINQRMLARLMRGDDTDDLLGWVAYAEAVEDGAFRFYHEVRAEM